MRFFPAVVLTPTRIYLSSSLPSSGGKYTNVAKFVVTNSKSIAYLNKAFGRIFQRARVYHEWWNEEDFHSNANVD